MKFISYRDQSFKFSYDESRGNINIFAIHYRAFVKKLRDVYKDVPIFMLQALSDKHCRVSGIEAAYNLIRCEVENVTLLPSDKWGVEISNDGTHPTSDGYARMGECLADALNNEIKNFRLMMGLIGAGNNPQAKYDCCGCGCSRRG